MIVSLDSNGAVLKQYTSKVLVQTRKHSIRMRTVHGSDRRGGGVLLGGLLPQGVCASPGGVLPGLCFWGCVLRGGCASWGVSVLREGCIPACTEAPLSPCEQY